MEPSNDDCERGTAIFSNGIDISSSEDDSNYPEQDFVNDEQFSHEISKLRDLLPLRTDIDFQDCDDSFLLRFLQARRFNVDCAFDLLCTYFEFRKKNSNLFKDLKASELRYVLEDGFPCVLPYLDTEGSKFVVLFAGTWDIETFDVELIIKALILSFQHLSKEREVCQKGIILLVDFSGWTTNHTKKLNIGYISKITAIFQECFPIWFRNVHFVNQPWYVNALITLMKPFMKDNVYERIFLHGNNMVTLHNHISPEDLPAEFGGNRTEVDQCYWANLLLAAEKRSLRKESTIRRGENPLRFSLHRNSVDLLEPSESEPLLCNLDEK